MPPKKKVIGKTKPAKGKTAVKKAAKKRTVRRQRGGNNSEAPPPYAEVAPPPYSPDPVPAAPEWRYTPFVPPEKHVPQPRVHRPLQQESKVPAALALGTAATLGGLTLAKRNRWLSRAMRPISSRTADKLEKRGWGQ